MRKFDDKQVFHAGERLAIDGQGCSCAWACIQAEVRRLLGRDDVVPGMVAVIQTHGELLHWHPHIHTLVTCDTFTPEDEPP